MKTLLPIETSPDGQQVVSALLLYKFLDVQTSFDNWFARFVNQCGLLNQEDFWPTISKNSIDTQEYDFNISLHVAKHFCQVETTLSSEDAFAHFVTSENSFFSPSNPAFPEQGPLTPRVTFFESVNRMVLPILIGEAVKVLNQYGMPTKHLALFERLRFDKVLDGYNRVSQEYYEDGYFTERSSKYCNSRGIEGISYTTLVTEKGLKWLYQQYFEHFASLASIEEASACL